MARDAYHSKRGRSEMQLMPWPDDESYFKHFRSLVLLLCFWLVIDQTLFWQWNTSGAFTPISLFSWLPQVFLESKACYYLISALSIIFGTLWHFRIFPKTTSVFTCLCFGLAATFYLQNLPFGDHRQSVFWMLLALLSAREFSLNLRSFFALAALAACSTYFLAGVEKLLWSGLAWPNGASLQVFVHYLGRPTSILRGIILSSTTLSKILQWLILALECGVLGLFFNQRLRWFILLSLLAFHIGIEEIFFYRFFPNYIVLFYLFGIPDLTRRFRASK